VVLLFFDTPATAENYTLSLHDALPICSSNNTAQPRSSATRLKAFAAASSDETKSPVRTRSSSTAFDIEIRRPTAQSLAQASTTRSEEHTSELQSLAYLVCRLLLEKKKE